MVSMGPKRILFIIPEMSVGGAQRSLAKISFEMAKDHLVWVVVFDQDSRTAYDCGGEMISLDVRGGKNWLGKAISMVNRVTKLRAVKRRLNIDVAISFLEGADYINILSQRKERVVLSIRGSKLHDENMHRRFFFLRRYILIPFLYRKANLIIAVNHGIALELTIHFGINVPIRVIFNYYDLPEIKTLASASLDRPFEFLYKSPVLITTGRLAVEKRISFLIRVFHRLKYSVPDARLMIVGDGPEYENLVSLGRELGLRVQEKGKEEPRAELIFAGNQTNVYPFIQRSVLYLMASTSEGFPNGVAEAMVCGLPVISTDCPYGPREILAPGTELTTLEEPEFAPFGILMPLATDSDGAIDSWTKTIEKLINDNHLRKEYAQKSFVRAGDFSKETSLRQWIEAIGGQG